MSAYTPITTADEQRARADLLGQRLADGAKLIEASRRAARIVGRVLPVLPLGVPNFEDLGDFYDRSRRFGDRNALFAAILPRMNAKALRPPESYVRPCAALYGSYR